MDEERQTVQGTGIPCDNCRYITINTDPALGPSIAVHRRSGSIYCDEEQEQHRRDREHLKTITERHMSVVQERDCSDPSNTRSLGPSPYDLPTLSPRMVRIIHRDD